MLLVIIGIVISAIGVIWGILWAITAGVRNRTKLNLSLDTDSNSWTCNRLGIANSNGKFVRCGSANVAITNSGNTRTTISKIEYQNSQGKYVPVSNSLGGFYVPTLTGIYKGKRGIDLPDISLSTHSYLKFPLKIEPHDIALGRFDMSFLPAHTSSDGNITNVNLHIITPNKTVKASVSLQPADMQLKKKIVDYGYQPLGVMWLDNRPSSNLK